MLTHAVTAVLSEPRTGRGQGSYLVVCNWAEDEDVTNYDGAIDFCPFCGEVIDSTTPKAEAVIVVDGSVAN